MKDYRRKEGRKGSEKIQIKLYESEFEVCPVRHKDTKDFILNKHYAQRMPSISYAFGLFLFGKLEGICTFGKPVNNWLCRGVCGEEHSHRVFELNRLIVNEGLPKNTLSRFVSQCLKQLKKYDLIIVSYADEGKGHHGYIYQATNWIYTGKTKERTDKYIPDGKHHRHATDEYAHLRKVRTAKHRYVYFTGESKKHFSELLKYDIHAYPKGINTNYTLGEKLKDKIINKIDGTEYYE